MKPLVSSFADASHPFSKYGIRNRGFLTIAVLLVLLIGLQAAVIGAIFWLRTSGSSFDPELYSNYERKRSDASVDSALGLSEAREMQRSARIAVNDGTSIILEKAEEELDLARTRRSELRIVKEGKEKEAHGYLQQAENSIKSGNLPQAVQLLRQSLQISDDYLPAIRKLAIVYEQEQDIALARFQWEKALGIAMPESSEALEAQQHLDRLARVSFEVRKPSALSTTASQSTQPPIPNTLSFVQVAHTDLPLETADPRSNVKKAYDLRFNLKIVLHSQGSDPYVDISQTKVEIAFYDQSYSAEGLFIPIKVCTTSLQPKNLWSTKTEQTLSLNYELDKGWFEQQIKKYGSSYAFCGYVVKAYYRGKLQDTYIYPEALSKSKSIVAGATTREKKP